VKLLHSATSPFARKVRVVIAERGLSVELEAASPLDEGSPVRRFNPLGKVPVLLLDDGSSLFDSPVICEYLDSLGDAPPLLPSTGQDRWTDLRTQALADGILDAAFNIVTEGRRPEAERSAGWVERWTLAIISGVAMAEDQARKARQDWTLGAIALACALGYLDFRLSRIAWRAANPTLASWYATQAVRPCMANTAPS
jgi:glutathione S-transferase